MKGKHCPPDRDHLDAHQVNCASHSVLICETFSFSKPHWLWVWYSREGRKFLSILVFIHCDGIGNFTFHICEKHSASGFWNFCEYPRADCTMGVYVGSCPLHKNGCQFSLMTWSFYNSSNLTCIQNLWI